MEIQHPEQRLDEINAELLVEQDPITRLLLHQERLDITEDLPRE